MDDSAEGIIPQKKLLQIAIPAFFFPYNLEKLRY